MLRDELVLTFSEAAKALPKVNGRRPHASTLWRWARKGVQGIRLETRRLGGRFVTSLEALDRFSKALAELELPCRQASFGSSSESRSNSQRQRDIARAEAELSEAGI